MFKEKGVILKSALATNVKVTLALWVDDDPERTRLLAKPTVRRLNAQGSFRTNQPYKMWLGPRELRALATTLERAAVLMDEYQEGTLDLEHILAEDEDARMFTQTESVMFPTIEGMFDMSEHLEKEVKEGTNVKQRDANLDTTDDEMF